MIEKTTYKEYGLYEYVICHDPTNDEWWIE